MNRKPLHSPSPRYDRKPVELAERLRSACMVALLALLVARPFTPGDSIAALGDGLPAVMLTLVVLCVFLGSLVLGTRRQVRFGAVDAAVVVLFAVEILAAAVGAQGGEPRAGVNMMWELVALATMYLLGRQLFRPADTRAVLTVMIAVALTQSVFGLHQYFVSMPADRALYLEDPDAAMRIAQLDAPAGSPMRQLYEQRLMSTEPMGRFDLPNSLAGFLATWLIVLIAGTLLIPRKHASIWIIVAAVAVPMTSCLLLTKSRSALLAIALGLLAAAFVLVGRTELARRSARSIVVAGMVGILLLIGIVWSLGGLDTEVLSEAPKSLGYRLQYWESTLAMIADDPWLGCGGGNFQNRYTQYKLPTASEEIADPHNFLFDVWANSGTLALVALVAVLVALARVVWIGRLKSSKESIDLESRHPPLPLLLSGTVAGFVLAFALGLLGEVPLSPLAFVVGIAIACGCVLLLRKWSVAAHPTTAVPALGILVMLVNLTAAGGIHFPAVAATLWLLIALTVNVSEDESRHIEAPRPALIGGLILSITMVLGCYHTAYLPVLKSRALLRRTDDPKLSYQQRVQFLHEAAEADSLSPQPWRALASLEAQRVQSAPISAANLDALQTYVDGYLHRNPGSSTAQLQVGNWYWDIFQASQNVVALQAATNAYRRSVALYPNDATRRARLALALEALQQPDDAALQRETALRLDRVTPHVDKKLPEPLRQQLFDWSQPRN